MAKLGDVCEILDSKRVPITASDRQSGPYPYYGANGIQDYVADYIFDDELVLLAEDGGNFGSKEKPIAYRVSGKCWVNNHAHVLKPKAGLDVDYLCYSLMFYDVTGLVNGATRQKLNQAEMRKMEIPLPPLDEQRRIAAVLDKVSGLIAKRREQLDKLDELLKARFVEMFGDPVSNPKGWNIIRLSELGDCKNGMNFHTDDSGVEIHCLGVGDFKNLSSISDTAKLPIITLNEMPTNDYLLKNGDIVFVRSNGNKALVGRSVIVYPDDTPTTFSGFCIRFRIQNPIILPQYLLSVLKTASMRKQMTGRGANIQNLNQKILSELKIPVSPLPYQEEYIDFTIKIDKSKLTIQQSLDKLEVLKKALMQQYFG